MDLYARPSKRGGAWANAYVGQSHLLGTRPVVGNHMNIPKPPAGQPTLLTWDEVNTLFHEFGHNLHTMLSDVRYPSQAGTAVPRDYVDTVRELGRDVNAAMAGFIRGQGTVCLVLGIFYAAGLTFAGLKFGLAIGLLAGALTFIPYAGAMTGGVLAIGVALVQFWPDYWSIGLVVAVFAVGQFLEGNFLSPKLVGKSIGLHPVWLMFALFAFGYVFGFVGLLLAVPLAAAAGVLVRFGLKQYLTSRLYLGKDDTEGSPVPVAIVAAEANEQRPA